MQGWRRNRTELTAAREAGKDGSGRKKRNKTHTLLLHLLILILFPEERALSQHLHIKRQQKRVRESRVACPHERIFRTGCIWISIHASRRKIEAESSPHQMG